MGKLFVLIRNDLKPSYQAVQAGHAVAQWMLDNKDQKWNNQTLVYLQVPDMDHLEVWASKLNSKAISFSQFNEPDINNQVTALACYTDKGIFDKLKLMGA